MLDKRFVRDHPDAVREAARKKGADVDVDEILRLDEQSRKLTHEFDQTQARKKALSKQFAKADPAQREELRRESTALDERLRELREETGEIGDRLQDLLLRTPQIPWEGSPVGPDESANVRIRTYGAPPEFDFPVLDHVELCERRDWAEFARARKVAGERAYALKGDLLLLERAVHSYALDLLVREEFTPISVPSIVKEMPLIGSGQFPKGREETYELAADGAFLAGTAEVALVGLHSGEILERNQLPILYAGISPCFRREIGSASRDVRGLLRVHQFEKVEQFVLCEAREGEAAYWQERLLGVAERILQELDLHYEVVECCTGDMGLGKYRMNDINTWFPSLEMLRETHSCSSLHDWQARRANLRYRDRDGSIKFVYTLNNTAVATPRLLAALIENKQTEDARVEVPEVLRSYLGGRELL
jgi:seryl-tRNA synthetase